ncbi:MAG: tripartite tricarboxylate transporter substrate-binding protein [Reyranella sp.]
MPAVPYRSTPQSLAAVISGEVPVTLDSLGASSGHILGASSGHIAGGRLRALAVTSAKRSERLPDVPTMLELGLDPREWVAWYAFMAPKGTPDDVILKLNGAINQALGEEAYATRIRELGASPRITTPAETLAFIKAERADFGAIAKAGKIRVEWRGRADCSREAQGKAVTSTLWPASASREEAMSSHDIFRLGSGSYMVNAGTNGMGRIAALRRPQNVLGYRVCADQKIELPFHSFKNAIESNISHL